ncbi:MAG: EscU/YscU/HrcU family type III secretion system export apparatus switch protein [Desulfobacteraceae bacterium]|jgi:flagellar biosynthesis protein
MTEDDEIKRVVGLKYIPREGPPKVILKGAGKTAREVIDQARELAEHKIVQDKKLLDQLFRLPVDAPIDADLFQLVAVLLVHIYQLDEEARSADKWLS